MVDIENICQGSKQDSEINFFTILILFQQDLLTMYILKIKEKSAARTYKGTKYSW